MIITFDYNHHFLIDTKRKGKIIDSMNLIQRLMSTWWTNHWSQIDKINFLVYFDGLLRYLIHSFRSKLKKSKSKIPPQITVNNDLMTQKRTDMFSVPYYSYRYWNRSKWIWWMDMGYGEMKYDRHVLFWHV